MPRMTPEEEQAQREAAYQAYKAQTQQDPAIAGLIADAKAHPMQGQDVAVHPTDKALQIQNSFRDFTGQPVQDNTEMLGSTTNPDLAEIKRRALQTIMNK